MKQEWFSPGRYDCELGLQPGAWTMEEILHFKGIRTVLSLGPSTAINEHIFAAKHPELMFTLFDKNASALMKAEQGVWPVDDADVRGKLWDVFMEKKWDAYIRKDDDAFRARTTPKNIRYVHGHAPLPPQETFDLCIAFNSLPAGIGRETWPVYQWLFDSIRDHGYFVNEWGLFQKSDRVRRVVRPDDTSSHSIHVEEIINAFLLALP